MARFLNKAARTINDAVDETVVLQRLVSDLLQHTADNPMCMYTLPSIQLLMRRCVAHRDHLQQLQESNTDSVVLSVLAQHIVLLGQSIERLETLERTVASSQAVVSESDKAVFVARMNKFKKALAKNGGKKT